MVSKLATSFKPFRAFYSLLFLCICVYTAQVSAAVTAQVDRNRVYEGESFTLTLSSDSQNTPDPDLSPLNKNFDILSNSQSSQIQMTNGAVTANKNWSIGLMPKDKGTFTIPSISFGQQSTRAITIEVLAANSSSQKNTTRDVFLELAIEPKQVYVQAEVSYQLRLYHNGSLQEGNLSEPEIPGAIVHRIGEDSQFETMVNGQRYKVIERNYGIFPQNSGELVIPPIQFNGNVVDTRGQRSMRSFSRFFQSTRQMRLATEEQSINVLAKPAEFSGAWWIPAQALILSEEWSGALDAVKAGEPITRTITLRAVGLTGSQLPTLEPKEINGIKSYPDQPITETITDGNRSIGVRTDKIAFVAQKAGNIELPAVEIAWWDTTENRQKLAILPAQTLRVLPAQNTQQDLFTNRAKNPPSSIADTTPDDELAPPQQTLDLPQTAPKTSFTTIWPWIAAVFFVAWLVTGWLLLQQRKQPRRQEQPPTDPAIKEKQALRELEKAHKTGDARAIKDALLVWAKSLWPDHPPLSLGALAQQFNDNQPLTQAILDLDNHLYGHHTQPWSNTDLIKSIKSASRIKPEASNQQRHTLAPLYPSSSSAG